MLARVTEEYLRTSAERIPFQTHTQVSQGGGYRVLSQKLPERIDGSLGNGLVPRKSSEVITEATVWGLESDGRIIIEGDVFNEADFDDIEIEDWEVDRMSLCSQHHVTAPSDTESQDYFKDDDDIDWGSVLDAPSVEDTTSIQPVVRSSTLVGPDPPDIPDPEGINLFPPMDEIVPDEETGLPTDLPPAQNESESLAKLLFPSSAPQTQLPWSSSPVRDPKPTRRTLRTLPWKTNPTCYVPEDLATYNQNETAHLKSLVRAISTISAEPTVNWDVLGITERNLRSTFGVVAPGVKLDRVSEPDLVLAAGIPRQEKTEGMAIPMNLGDEAKPLAGIFLSQEQSNVRKLVIENKKSVFFTGSAGNFDRRQKMAYYRYREIGFTTRNN
jgi:hypothetical protein